MQSKTFGFLVGNDSKSLLIPTWSLAYYHLFVCLHLYFVCHLLCSALTVKEQGINPGQDKHKKCT